MTKQLEHMLLSNNQEFHGIIKTMYSQWYRAQIYDMIVCAIVLIALVVATVLILKQLHKEYKSLDPSNWNHPDSFSEFMYDNHFVLMVLLIFLAILIITIIIAACIEIPHFIIEPKVEFLKYILTND